MTSASVSSGARSGSGLVVISWQAIVELLGAHCRTVLLPYGNRTCVEAVDGAAGAMLSETLGAPMRLTLARLLALPLLFACVGNPSAKDTGPTGTEELDPDGDGHIGDADCDEEDPSRHEGADERCDGVDEDCDGTVDEDAVDATSGYLDEDTDGFGDPDTHALSCEPRPGEVNNGLDCDDSDPSIRPDAEESGCDGVDTNCDGIVGGGDDDSDGWDARTDCDDADPGRYPGAAETCDGIDEDCDGEIDNDALDIGTFYADADGDGYGDPAAGVNRCDLPAGYVPDHTDCDDSTAEAYPGAPERCDDHDQDCDGVADNDAINATTWYADRDGDGAGDPSAPQVACDAPPDHVTDDGDCDDTDSAVSPAATEIAWDGVDQDCADGDLSCADVEAGVSVSFRLSGTTVGAGDDGESSCEGDAAGEDVTVYWTAPSADTYVFSTQGSGTGNDTVLAIYAGDCSGTEYVCVDDDNTGDTFASTVTAYLDAGESVIVQVSGYSGQPVDYVLTIDVFDEELDCTDGTDDEGDGYVDCDDDDCDDDPECQESDCANGVDDDGDRYVDCDDSDCDETCAFSYTRLTGLWDYDDGRRCSYTSIGTPNTAASCPDCEFAFDTTHTPDSTTCDTLDGLVGFDWETQELTLTYEHSPTGFSVELGPFDGSLYSFPYDGYDLLLFSNYDTYIADGALFVGYFKLYRTY